MKSYRKHINSRIRNVVLPIATLSAVLLACLDVAAQPPCQVSIPCDKNFEFKQECFQFDEEKEYHFYPFETICPVTDPKIPKLRILELVETKGMAVITPASLRRLLKLPPGYRCDQMAFDIRYFELKITIRGNTGHPISLLGSINPSWCFDFDGRYLAIHSFKAGYVLDDAPVIVKRILNHEKVRKAIDDKISEKLDGTILDIVEVLGFPD